MDTLTFNTELDIDELLAPYEDTDDGNNHKTHIVNPPANLHIWQPGMSSADVVFIARSQGISVTALCGYTWVPKRNPDKYEACEKCVREAQRLMSERGE